jgi:serine/threonine-protein kinase
MLRWLMGRTYLAMQRPQPAVVAYEAAIEPSGRNHNVLTELALAYGLAGRREDAHRILRELQQLSQTRYVSPYLLALVHLAVGEKKEAYRELERSLAERTPGLGYAAIATEPMLDVFRGDMEFDKILAKARALVKLAERVSASEQLRAF